MSAMGSHDVHAERRLPLITCECGAQYTSRLAAAECEVSDREEALNTRELWRAAGRHRAE